MLVFLFIKSLQVGYWWLIFDNISWIVEWIDPSHVIGLFPDLLPVDFRKQLEYPEAVAILQGRELEQAVLALIKYLTEVGNSS